MRKIAFFILLLATLLPGKSQAKLVLADSGASAYVMGNSLVSTTLAISMGADIVKLDVTLSSDNEVVVLPSPYLEDLSNVAELFPERKREDSHYYVLDFNLAELRQLRLRQPQEEVADSPAPPFGITTLGEQLALIHTLEKGLGKSIDVAVTLVKPWLHKKENRDLSSPVLRTLAQYAGTGVTGKKFLLSYEVEELQRIARKLLPRVQIPIQLVQLIDQEGGQHAMVEEWGELKSYNYDLLFSNSGLRALAGYVAAIAIPKTMLVDEKQQPKRATFIERARKLGITLFTFPVETDMATRIAPDMTFEQELELLYFTIGVDGVISRSWADVRRYLDSRSPLQPLESESDASLPADTAPGVDPLNLVTPSPMENE